MAKEIKLNKGFVTVVDDEDFEWLSKFKWCVNHGYAKRTVRNGLKFVTVRMHREILQASNEMQVDHINGNKLDNRRCNLRLATSSQNQQNRRVGKDNTSGFKGVSWHKKSKKWCAQITVNRKVKHIGIFDDSIEAAKAYDKAAKELHGVFANTNFK